MAKAVAKSKKVAEKIAAKSKSSAPARKAAPPARKALKKSPAKPAPKVVAKAASKPPAKAAVLKAPAAKAPVKPAIPAVKAGKWVYTFGDGKAEGQAGLPAIAGGKGANPAEMANLRLPGPPPLTIPPAVSPYFYPHGKTHPGG